MVDPVSAPAPMFSATSPVCVKATAVPFTVHVPCSAVVTLLIGGIRHTKWAFMVAP